MLIFSTQPNILIIKNDIDSGFGIRQFGFRQFVNSGFGTGLWF